MNRNSRSRSAELRRLARKGMSAYHRELCVPYLTNPIPATAAPNYSFNVEGRASSACTVFHLGSAGKMTIFPPIKVTG